MASRGHVVVRSLSRRATRGTIEIAGLKFPCALGRSGGRVRKWEGDGATPSGRYGLLWVLYRADRRGRPRTALPVRRIRPRDGWCDASGDRNYNKAIRLPYPGSAEQMWRADGLYDLMVVLDHNTRPRKRGAGSAIFMHLARTGYSPTEGCVALAEPHLLRLLARLRSGAVIVLP